MLGRALLDDAAGCGLYQQMHRSHQVPINQTAYLAVTCDGLPPCAESQIALEGTRPAADVKHGRVEAREPDKPVSNTLVRWIGESLPRGGRPGLSGRADAQQTVRVTSLEAVAGVFQLDVLGRQQDPRAREVLRAAEERTIRLRVHEKAAL
jgi:hypothetical protein